MSMQDFELGKELGKGAFGSVQIVKRKQDNISYAMKRVKIGQLNQKDKENSLNEIRILASLQHQNIIGYKEAFFDETSQTLNIVMEYADDGDLSTKIKYNKTHGLLFRESTIWDYFIQIITGLQFLHDNHIMHRDLKSANIFLMKDGTIKIGDLNVSKIAKMGMAFTQIGTPYYASPEIWNDKPYDYKNDIWSVGCILYELCQLQTPFRGTSIKELSSNICKGVYNPISRLYSKELSIIIAWMLNINPNKRPTCDMLLKNEIIVKKMEEIKQTIGHFSMHDNFDEENKMNLIKTIKMPKNMKEINRSLPMKRYNNWQREEMMMNDEYEKTKKKGFYDKENDKTATATNCNTNNNCNNNVNNVNVNNVNNNVNLNSINNCINEVNNKINNINNKILNSNNNCNNINNINNINNNKRINNINKKDIGIKECLSLGNNENNDKYNHINNKNNLNHNNNNNRCYNYINSNNNNRNNDNINNINNNNYNNKQYGNYRRPNLRLENEGNNNNNNNPHYNHNHEDHTPIRIKNNNKFESIQEKNKIAKKQLNISTNKEIRNKTPNKGNNYINHKNMINNLKNQIQPCKVNRVDINNNNNNNNINVIRNNNLNKNNNINNINNINNAYNKNKLNVCSNKAMERPLSSIINSRPSKGGYKDRANANLNLNLNINPINNNNNNNKEVKKSNDNCNVNVNVADKKKKMNRPFTGQYNKNYNPRINNNNNNQLINFQNKIINSHNYNNNYNNNNNNCNNNLNLEIRNAAGNYSKKYINNNNNVNNNNINNNHGYINAHAPNKAIDNKNKNKNKRKVIIEKVNYQRSDKPRQIGKYEKAKEYEKERLKKIGQNKNNRGTKNNNNNYHGNFK